MYPLATGLAVAAPEVAAALPSTAFSVSLGTGLLIIGFTAQYLIKHRLKHEKLKRTYSWIAWGFAILGGTAVGLSVASQTGVTAAGAAVVSVVGLLALAVDFADKRPDWPAFFIAVVLPSFMQAASGPAGNIFHVLLAVPTAVNVYVGSLLGF